MPGGRGICVQTERLDKILAGSGLFTRSQARAAILAGEVAVDGAPVRRPEAKVCRSSQVTARGREVDTDEFVYYMMNKPAGTICATEDGAYPAVTSLLPRHLQARGLFPVGRLDADVTGLLLLTDDGAFAHRVTAPRSEIPKVYEVHTDGELLPAHIALLAAGVTLADGTAYRPAGLTIDQADPCTGLVTVTEGRFHEVKNLMAACGRHVTAMRRLAIGGLRLDETLKIGNWKKLSWKDVNACFS